MATPLQLPWRAKDIVWGGFPVTGRKGIGKEWPSAGRLRKGSLTCLPGLGCYRCLEVCKGERCQEAWNVGN